MTKILITGGAGFAGHHFVEHFLKHTDWHIAVLDQLNYASKGWSRLKDIEVYNDLRVETFSADLSKPISEGVASEIGNVDYILHMAAETHVDRSIIDPMPFVMSNVVGTTNLLLYALKAQPKQFIYFSTDEVFGPAPPGTDFKEWDRYNSGNPYAASKAGGEEMAMAFANTYDLNVIVTHTMNLFGERQHPEKFIPSTINKVMNGEKVIIHASRDGVPGSRYYIHCRNAADGLHFILKSGPFGRAKFNIVGEKEVDNLSLAQFIADVLGRPLEYELVDFHSSRPGHDLRYALDGSALADRGWTPPKTFEQSLEKTIKWTLERPEWLKS
jgi:dTDP-glucose 4,6-dehydratase